MERTTPYAAPINRAGRIFCLALAAIGLAGAGVGIGAYTNAPSPAAQPSPVVTTAEVVPLPVPPKPIVPADVTPQRSPEIDRLVQAFNDSENRAGTGRITWQVTPRNKVNLYWSEQYNSSNTRGGGSATLTPEADGYGLPLAWNVFR